jgi:pimeloyl-ACP methyl ester carboxylesterase
VPYVERIAYEVEGAGEPVVMIHGLGGTSNVFTPLLPAFSRHKSIKFDLPGSGRSARFEGPLGCQLFLEKTLLIMDKAGVRSAHVVAHSMGTIVAAHLAASLPERVKSLALFGPLLAPPDQARVALRARGAKAREGDMQPIADALVQGSTSSETRQKRPVAAAFVRESLMRQHPSSYGRSCDALAGMQAADTAKIACPALLVTGDEDAVSPPSSVRAMGDRIKGSRVEVLRGCGHWTPVEKPEECMLLVRKFLEEITRRKSPWPTSSSPTFA